MYENWTDEEKQFLRDNYNSLSSVQLADILGKTQQAIYARAKILGIRKREVTKLKTRSILVTDPEYQQVKEYLKELRK